MILKAASLLLLLASGLFAGCATAPHLETRISSSAKPEEVCRVAVLPIQNQTINYEAGLMAYRILYSRLVNSGLVEVEPEGDVLLFMQRNRLLPGQMLGSVHYADLEQKMGVDAIIRGKISDAGTETSRLAEAIPYVALQIDLVDARTGKLLLSSYHRRWGDDFRTFMHFGTLRTYTGLMATMFDEIIQDWKMKGVGSCRQ